LSQAEYSTETSVKTLKFSSPNLIYEASDFNEATDELLVLLA